MEFIVMISALAIMSVFFYVASKDFDDFDFEDFDFEEKEQDNARDFSKLTKGIEIGDYYINYQHPEDRNADQVRILKVFPDEELIGFIQYLDLKSGRVFTDDIETFQNTYRKI